MQSGPFYFHLYKKEHIEKLKNTINLMNKYLNDITLTFKAKKEIYKSIVMDLNSQKLLEITAYDMDLLLNRILQYNQEREFEKYLDEFIEKKTKILGDKFETMQELDFYNKYLRVIKSQIEFMYKYNQIFQKKRRKIVPFLKHLCLMYRHVNGEL